MLHENTHAGVPRTPNELWKLDGMQCLTDERIRDIIGIERITRTCGVGVKPYIRYGFRGTMVKFAPNWSKRLHFGAMNRHIVTERGGALATYSIEHTRACLGASRDNH